MGIMGGRGVYLLSRQLELHSITYELTKLERGSRLCSSPAPVSRSGIICRRDGVMPYAVAEGRPIFNLGAVFALVYLSYGVANAAHGVLRLSKDTHTWCVPFPSQSPNLQTP